MHKGTVGIKLWAKQDYIMECRRLKSFLVFSLQEGAIPFLNRYEWWSELGLSNISLVPLGRIDLSLRSEPDELLGLHVMTGEPGDGKG